MSSKTVETSPSSGGNESGEGILAIESGYMTIKLYQHPLYSDSRPRYRAGTFIL